MTSTIVCTCPKFISPILKREVESLGYTVQAAYQTGVEIEGTFEDVLRLNLLLRTAHRVLWLVQRFKAQTPDDLFYNARSIEWEQFINENGYVCIVSSVDTPSITNTQFANQKLKDAIVDRLRSVTGKRPNSGPGTDKTVVFLYWKGSECVVYLDTSGTPISKRGYRQQPHKAPLNELLAAAIVLSTKWDKDTAFVNPMCGSGTLAIEAAMIARNIPSQYRRTNFGFMHIKLFDAAVWEELRRKEKRNEKQELSFPIIASDRDSQAVAATRTNARSAGVLHDLDVRICDFAKTPIPEGEGVVVLNPEYGKRLGVDSELEMTYSRMGDWFKQQCTGKKGYIFTGNIELAKKIGLKPSRKTEFFNGDIECRLFEYELYSGSKRTPEQEQSPIAKKVAHAYKIHKLKE